MLPAIRKRLKSLTAGNKGLQDILRSMTAADEIISVETYNGKIHNTKLIIRVDRSKVTGTELPEQERYVNRAHFYNRVPISDAIPSGASYPTDNVLTAIASLNNLGCDFTEDDVEFIDGTLVAKEMSLGYYNAAAGNQPPLASDCNPTSLTMQHFNNNTIAETHLNGALTIQVVQNGTTVTQIVRPTQLPPDVDLTALGMIRWFAEGQGIVFVDGYNEGFGQYKTYGRQITGSMNEGEDGVPGVLNPTSIRIMKTQGEPVETDIFEWLLEAEEGLDAETLAEARSLGLSVRSCGTQYWEGI